MKPRIRVIEREWIKPQIQKSCTISGLAVKGTGPLDAIWITCIDPCPEG